MAKVVVVDYGVGNLHSVALALRKLGADVEFSGSPDQVVRADRLVLPGVGSFAHGMRELHKGGLVEALRTFASIGRPFLGICLGMQLMFDTSDEFGVHEGLGLIRGRVMAIPAVGADGVPHKIPHIGWSQLLLAPGRVNWDDSILADTPVEASVYFVHGYTAFPCSPEHRVADCDYDGCQVAAAVQADNLHGCQFHPEKSGPTGLAILRRFIGL